MYLCYIDESGTHSIPGNTSHYILAGLAIPIWHWKTCENEVSKIKNSYQLTNSEIHTGWILRKYPEQIKIPNFELLNYSERKQEVESLRLKELYRLQRTKSNSLKQTKKNFRETKDYVHLTLKERRDFIMKLAETIRNWGFARLFAECIDKTHFSASPQHENIQNQAFEQVVSRFEHYLKIISKTNKSKNFGLLIHDNNETIAKQHTELMKDFHKGGTFWTSIEHIIETPLFVNSQLTGMIQIADICAYALRRYLENDEDGIFNLIFDRGDKKDSVTVGIRHYTNTTCTCKICTSHKR